MLDISCSTIAHAIVHQVGNQFREEGVRISPTEFQRSESLDTILLSRFLAPVLRTGQQYQLFHESNIALNPIYHYANRIFADPTEFVDASAAIAKHLYVCSTHPNIGAGEFLVILFEDIRQSGTSEPALGFFRVEQRDAFLDVKEAGDQLLLYERSGISVGKVQKGAVLLPSGSRVFVVDALGQKTKYWINSFLKASPSATGQKGATLAAAIIKGVASRTNTPAATLQFAQRVQAVLHESSEVTLRQLEGLSKDFVDTEAFAEILSGAKAKLEVDFDENIFLDSAEIARRSKSVITKTPIAYGVSLVTSKPDVTIGTVQIVEKPKGFRAIIEVELLGD